MIKHCDCFNYHREIIFKKTCLKNLFPDQPHFGTFSPDPLNPTEPYCILILQFSSAFDSYYVFVSIESYLASESITSIDFIQFNQQGRIEKSNFSCFINDEQKLAGTFKKQQDAKAKIKFTGMVDINLK